MLDSYRDKALYLSLSDLVESINFRNSYRAPVNYPWALWLPLSDNLKLNLFHLLLQGLLLY